MYLKGKLEKEGEGIFSLITGSWIIQLFSAA